MKSFLTSLLLSAVCSTALAGGHYDITVEKSGGWSSTGPGGTISGTESIDSLGTGAGMGCSTGGPNQLTPPGVQAGPGSAAALGTVRVSFRWNSEGNGTLNPAPKFVVVREVAEALWNGASGSASIAMPDEVTVFPGIGELHRGVRYSLITGSSTNEFALEMSGQATAELPASSELLFSGSASFSYSVRYRTYSLEREGVLTQSAGYVDIIIGQPFASKVVNTGNLETNVNGMNVFPETFTWSVPRGAPIEDYQVSFSSYTSGSISSAVVKPFVPPSTSFARCYFTSPTAAAVANESCSVGLPFGLGVILVEHSRNLNILTPIVLRNTPPNPKAEAVGRFQQRQFQQPGQTPDEFMALLMSGSQGQQWNSSNCWVAGACYPAHCSEPRSSLDLGLVKFVQLFLDKSLWKDSQGADHNFRPQTFNVLALDVMFPYKSFSPSFSFANEHPTLAYGTPPQNPPLCTMLDTPRVNLPAMSHVPGIVQAKFSGQFQSHLFYQPPAGPSGQYINGAPTISLPVLRMARSAVGIANFSPSSAGSGPASWTPGGGALSAASRVLTLGASGFLQRSWG
jgi:hypothetical protein